MVTRDHIERQIDSAFADARMPATAYDLAPPSIESPYVVQNFYGRSREDITLQTFAPSLHMEDFTYMTAKAVEYYLPAVLKLMLDEASDFELWIYLSGFLESVRQDYGTTLRNLTHAQLDAIACWAEYVHVAKTGALGFDPAETAELARLYRELADGSKR